MSRTKNFLSLEVWLGPMEGLRFSAELGSAPRIVRVGRLPKDRKTGLTNDFVLTQGVGVSSTHAEMRVDRGRFHVRDLGSTNGTFFARPPVGEEAEIMPGEIFLISLTPIRVDVLDEVAVEQQGGISGELPRITEPALQNILVSAREAAEHRGERYVDTRHLCDALIRSRNEWVQRSFREAGWSRDSALTDLWEGGLFEGPFDWLKQIFARPIETRPDVTGSIVSPKASLFLSETLRRLPGVPPQELETFVRKDLMRQLRHDLRGAVGGWLAAHRFPEVGDVERGAEAPPPPAPAPRRTGMNQPVRKDASADLADTGNIPQFDSSQGRLPPSVSMVLQAPDQSPVAGTAQSRRPDGAAWGGPATRLEEVPLPPPMRGKGTVAPAGPGPSARGAVPEAPVAEPPRVQPARPEAPPDPLLDQQAQQLAREILETAATYRFATASARRETLKRRLAKEVRGLPPEKRQALVDRLRTHFPLAVPPPVVVDAGEVASLKQRLGDLTRETERLRRELAEKRTKSSTVVRELPWRALLAQDDASQAALEKHLRAVRDLVDFAVNLEGFILGLVQSTTMPGSDVSEFRLPLYKNKLESLLLGLEEGKWSNLEKIKAYLNELQRWQVSILAGYHEAPRSWFEKLWKKISPAQIEAAPRSAGWKLAGETADWWELYRQAVRDLSPDVVQDQVLQTVGRLAKEEFDKLEKLNKRRSLE